MANPPAEEAAAPVAAPTKAEGRPADEPAEGPSDGEAAAPAMSPLLPAGVEAPPPDLGLPPTAVVAEDHQALLSLIAQVALVRHGVDDLAESDHAQLVTFLSNLSPTEARTLAYSLATTNVARPQDTFTSSPASLPPSPAVLPASGVAAEAPTWGTSTFQPTPGLAEDGHAYRLGSSSALDEEMARTSSAGGAAAFRDTPVAESRTVDPGGSVSVVPAAAVPFTTVHDDDRGLGGAGATTPRAPADVTTSVGFEPTPDVVQPTQPTASTDPFFDLTPFDPLPVVPTGQVDPPAIDPTEPSDSPTTDPTLPTDPPVTGPTEPAEPPKTDPTEPTDPPTTDPTGPIDPPVIGPIEPAEPPTTGPTDPTDPTLPIDPPATDPTPPPEDAGGGEVLGLLDLPRGAGGATAAMMPPAPSGEPHAGAYVIDADDEVIYPTADTLQGFEDVEYGPGGAGPSPETARLLLQLLDQQDAADGLPVDGHGDLLLALTDARGDDGAGHPAFGGYGADDAAFETFRGTPHGDGPDRMDDHAPAHGGHAPDPRPADDAPHAAPAPWIDDNG